MRAFGGDANRKAAILARLEAHIEAGDVQQRPSIWRDGKGSAVGCIIHDISLAVWEQEIGVPRSLGALLDVVTMSTQPPVANAAAFAVRWLNSVPVGADLTFASRALLDCILTHPGAGLLMSTKDETLRALIEQLSSLLRRALSGDVPAADEWKAIRLAAIAITDKLDPESGVHHISEAIEEAAWDPATSATGLSMAFLFTGTAKRQLAFETMPRTEEQQALARRLFAVAEEKAQAFPKAEREAVIERSIEEQDPEFARLRNARTKLMRDSYEGFLNLVRDTLVDLSRNAR